jgi:hypothetical protein
MKRPVVFIAFGMALTFVVLSGIAIIASNAMAGTRLREFGNGDIDVTIALSRPTAALPVGGSGSRAGDALHQRDLDYEEKLREMARMAQTKVPATFAPDPSEAPTATQSPLPTATRRTRVTASPAFTETPLPAPTEQRREDRREPEPTHTAQAPAQPQPPAPPADDHGGERNTPQPPAQPPPVQPPAPTDDHGGGNDGGSDNRGPSPSNTPKPDDSQDDSGGGGRDKPPDPTKEPKKP